MMPHRPLSCPQDPIINFVLLALNVSQFSNSSRPSRTCLLLLCPEAAFLSQLNPLGHLSVVSRDVRGELGRIASSVPKAQRDLEHVALCNMCGSHYQLA